MAKTISPDPENEQGLRAKILAGSQDLKDYTALAEILLGAAGREDEGLAVLDQALELALASLDRAAICADIAWFLYELGRTERAMTTAQRALSHVTGQAETPRVLMIRGLSHAVLANCHYYTDRVSSDRDARLALEAFEQLLSTHPDFEDFAEACLYAAGIYILRREYAKAVALYENALRGDLSAREKLSSLICLANALRCQGRYADAEGRLREALGLVEADRRWLTRVCFEMGKVCRLTNRPEEAVVAFERALGALDVNPFLRGDRGFVAEIRWELGNLYYDAKRYRDAIAAFREVIPDLLERYPELYCGTLIYLGHCYVLTGQHGKAQDCFQEVLASEQASNEEKAAAQEWLSSLPPLQPPRVH